MSLVGPKGSRSGALDARPRHCEIIEDGGVQFVKESGIADFGVRKLNELKGQILRKSIFS